MSRVYGASDPALGVTYSGFVNGETSSVLSGTLSEVDSEAAPTTAVGSYAGVITASGQTSTNYTITYVAGGLTVSPVALTITANGVSRVYGASDPALGVTYSGFVNGETSSVLGGTLSEVDSNAAPTTAAGSYAGVITASGQTSTNYTITYIAGNLTVTPAALTIAASGVSRVYGASDPALGVSYSGFVNGETSSVLGGTLSEVDSKAATTTSVGTYTGVVTVVGQTSTNYAITYVAGNLTVTPTALTISANGVTRVYGASDPTLGVTYSGFVNGETSSVLGGTLSEIDSNSAPTTAVGSYAGVITATGQTSTNYTITYIAGNLTVTPAALTITANGVSRVYGASDPTLGVTYSGFVNGESSTVLNGTLSEVDSKAATTTSVGIYTGVITASGLTSTNYTIASVAGNLTVTPAALTITANSVSRVYGASDPTLGVTYSGFVNGETSSVLGGPLSEVDSNSAPTTVVGSYAGAITANGQTSTNYTITYLAGNLTVTPAALTISANDVTRVYGASDPTLGVTYSGFVNGETSSVLGGTLSESDSNAAPTTAVGSYADVITASGQTSTNYTITYIAGNLTVTPAALTITANGVSRVYGASDSTLGVTYSGFVNGETSSVLGGTLSEVDSKAAPTTSVGNYTGVITASGQTSTNYTIAYVAGNLTVTPAALTITANNVSRVYGASDPTLGVTYSGFVNSEMSSVLGGTLSEVDSKTAPTTAVGTYSGVITASGQTSTNYTITYIAGNLTVTPAALTITANGVSRVYGASDPTLGVTYTGFVNGETFSVLGGTLSEVDSKAATTTAVGSYTGVIMASGQASTNYTITYVAGNLTVTPAALTITANGVSRVYGTPDPTLDVTYSGFVNGETSSVLGGTLSEVDSKAATTTAVGSFTGVITASGQTSTNYTITYVAGNLTVTPAPLTITGDSTTKTYGQTVTLAATEFTTSGLVNSDSVASVSLSSTGAAATAVVAGSPYAIIVSNAVGSGLGNYTITYVNGALTVNKANPTITTTPSMTTVALGTSSVTLNDTAMLSGGYNESGTIMFTLYLGSTFENTETVTTTGNGSYTTPTGYKLPTTGMVTGTYQWDASYSGDSNNNAFSDDNSANEQVVVSPASPAITTTPNVTTVVLRTSATLKDTAVLSGGYSPTGTITFTLLAPGGGTLDTETMAINGNGTYTTPTGYTLSTTSTVTGAYQWDASYASANGDNNAFTDDNATNEQVTVTVPPNVSVTKTADQATIIAGQTAGFVVTIANNGSVAATGVSLSDPLPAGTYNDVNWKIDTSDNTGTFVPGDFTIIGTTPNQVLTLASSFNDKLAVGQTIAIHITGVTTANDTGTSANPALIVGGLANYTVLYEGTGINQLSISNDTVDGNIGVSGGRVQFNGPGIIGGRLDFSAANTGQYQSTNSSNVGPTSVNYNVSAVMTAINAANSLSTAIGALPGTSISFNNSNQTVNESSGMLETSGGVNYRVFNVTSYSENNSDTVTINGDASGDPVVFNFAYSGDTNLGGQVALTGGLTDDQVMWNFESSNQNVQLNNNGETYAGVIILPNDNFTSDNYNLDGRVYGGADGNMQIVSGANVYAPVMTGTLPNTATVSATGDAGQPGEQASATVTVVSSVAPCCNLTGVTYSVYNPSTGVTTTPTDLSGNTAQGDTVTVTFTVPTGVYDQPSLVSYNAPEPFYNADDANLQTVFSSVTQVEGPGQHTLSITLPQTFYQLDFVCGTVITTLGPSGTNNFYRNQNRYIDGDNAGVNPVGSGILSLSGEVYGDLNVDGKLDNNDPGLANVTLTLTGTDAYGNSVSTTTTTNGSGNYTFSGLPFSNSGGYAVSVSPPTGESAGLATVGTVANVADGAVATSPDGVRDIVLGSSSQTAGAGYNFGIIKSSSVPGSNNSIVVLSPTVSGALTISGNARVSVPGAIVVDSSSSSAIAGSGTASLTASIIDVVGGYQKASGEAFSSSPNTGASSLADPLAGLVIPSTSDLTNYGSVNLTSGSQTISPGVYSSIKVSNSASLTMNAGTYIIKGGGFSVSGSANVSGSGVTIYNAGSNCPSTGGTYGSINLSSTGTFNLSAPSSGTYAGTLIFQSRDNTQTMSINVSGRSGSAITGTIYAASAQLVDGGTTPITGSLVVNLLTVSTGATANNLDTTDGGVAYSPAQVLSAYGINNLALDGTGQTIAIVDAYDDPNIFQAVDAFDNQFGLTGSGPVLYNQYGPASSFLTVLNENGQSTSLPGTDPNGPGTNNWEVEESLDVEWAHAVAPGARIVLVEANSQSLPDLMTAVATAASQPGVSVVSMTWGFAEGQTVFATDEANYDSTFNLPGVTFVASTGDYGAADPEYPAFSPNVLAVGGTSLNLNADNSYNSETGWGYDSASNGGFIGSGGGISMYEPEPAYQEGVQSIGSRTTPDVALVADPATGGWIADPYNLGADNPFQVVGGTSLSAPVWAGLVALVNEGRAAAGEANLNSSSPTETQQALYSLPQRDYNVITSGFNGYTANAGYNLVTGLGTPVANLLVGDLVGYQGPGTTYAGPTVGALQGATLVNTGLGGGDTANVFTVFSAITITGGGPGNGQGPDAASTISTPMSGTPAQEVVASHSVVTPATALGTTPGRTPGSLSQSGSVQAFGLATYSSPLGQTSQSPAALATSPVSSSLVMHETAWATAQAAVSSPVDDVNVGRSPASNREDLDGLMTLRPRTGHVSDAVLDELAADSVLWPVEQANGTITLPVLPTNKVTRDPVVGDPVSHGDKSLPATDYAAGLAVLGLAAGFWARGIGFVDARKRQSGRLFSSRKPITSTSRLPRSR